MIIYAILSTVKTESNFTYHCIPGTYFSNTSRNVDAILVVLGIGNVSGQVYLALFFAAATAQVN